MNLAKKEVQVIQPTIINGVINKIRVAAYCRVSTDSEDQANSFFAQMRYYTDYIKTNPEMELVDIYADEGISGGEIKKRNEFKRLIKDCKNKRIDRVLVKSVTRFARNSLECIETVRTLSSCGVTVYFENDKIDTEKMNSELILYLKSAFAQNELISASKRMKTSVRMKMQDGTYIASIPPYGYKRNYDTLEIIPEQAKIVKLIFNLYLQGYGYEKIIHYLNDLNIENGRWTQNGIKYILSNEKYVGDTLWQKKYTPDIFPMKLKYNNGEVPKYYCKDTHEPIISREDFEKVKELIAERTGKHNKRLNEEKPLLYKKIYCRHCGWAYKKVSTNEYKYKWVCSKKGRNETICHSKSLVDNDIFQSFVNMINKLIDNKKEILENTIYQLNSLRAIINKENNIILEIDNEIAQLGQENEMYTKLHTEHLLSDVLFFEKTGKIKANITELRARRLKVVNEDEFESDIEELKILYREIDKYDKHIFDFDKNLFQKVVNKIYVEENNLLMFELKCGLSLQEKI